MSTTSLATDSKLNWDGMDRRTGVPSAPLFGELLVECDWRPTDAIPAASEGWLRSLGYVKDRRTR